MKCPKCDEVLLMSERLGIEVDYCPTCRGVWLDRGEIDRLLEAERARSASTDAEVRASSRSSGPLTADPVTPGRPRRRRSWADLLEFD